MGVTKMTQAAQYNLRDLFVAKCTSKGKGSFFFKRRDTFKRFKY